MILSFLWQLDGLLRLRSPSDAIILMYTFEMRSWVDQRVRLSAVDSSTESAESRSQLGFDLANCIVKILNEAGQRAVCSIWSRLQILWNRIWSRAVGGCDVCAGRKNLCSLIKKSAIGWVMWCGSIPGHLSGTILWSLAWSGLKRINWRSPRVVREEGTTQVSDGYYNRRERVVIQAVLSTICCLCRLIDLMWSNGNWVHELTHCIRVRAHYD